MNSAINTTTLQKLPNREDHMCFGCGPRNQSGLKMEFFTDGMRVVSTLVVPGHLCGWDTMVHGGVISTVLDEIMSWAAIHLLKRIILTKSMNVDFFRPVQILSEITAEGRVLESVSEREAILEGLLYNSKGELCARSRGCFALFTVESAKRLGVLNQETIDSFACLLDA